MPSPTFETVKYSLPNDTLSFSSPAYGIDYIRTAALDVSNSSSIVQFHH